MIDATDLDVYVADSLRLATYADAIDRAIEDGDESARAQRPGPGEDWRDSDYRPVPRAVLALAQEKLASIRPATLADGAEAWLRLSGCDRERLGHVMALTMLGHGVGLDDDIPTTAYALGGATAQDRADLDSVRRLRDALPRVELLAFWNPARCAVEL